MNVQYCTLQYHKIQYRTVPKLSTVQDVTSLVDTYLLIKLLVLGRLDKSLVVGGGWVGDIAIIASSSRGPGGT